MLAVGALLIAGFHGWLLLQRLGDATIGEPGVLLRWLGGLGLVAAALYLRPRGVSLTRGRAALVFWLLVLLLHVGASPAELAGVDPRELLLALPWGVAGGLVCLAAARIPVRTRHAAPGARLRRPPLLAPPPRRSAGAAPARFAPRPPPFASAA